LKQLTFTVTNNLVYDQRMIRICTSLCNAGYSVTLVGVNHKGSSPPLMARPFRQKRINTYCRKGPGFYAEYNCRLFFYLLFTRADLFCCIDLDTILPVWLASVLRGKKRVYDAHEYFSQQKEIVTRPHIYKVWHRIEQKMVPLFPNGYTVGQQIATAFLQLYQVKYAIIRNMPWLKDNVPSTHDRKRDIIYQGAINEARGIEYLVPAMHQVDARLLLYGDGNYMEQTKKLIESNNLGEKVFLKGKLLPVDLESATAQAYIGVNLVENVGLNQYFSLANKFFDYIHHLVPQVTMDFPEYRTINKQYEVAVLIHHPERVTIAACLNQLLQDEQLYLRLQNNCFKARAELNWQREEKILIAFYHHLFTS